MNRDILKNIGYDYAFTVYPHDYRREGWVVKVAHKDDLSTYYTDWRKIDRRDRVKLEDWENFLWSVDPTSEVPSYIKRSGMRPDVITGPDFSAGSFVRKIRDGIGSWATTEGDLIDKQRSRANANKVKIKKGFDPKKIKDNIVLIADDWGLSLKTMKGAIREADEAGAKEIHALVVHGQFKGDSLEKTKKMELKNAKGPFFHASDTVCNPVAEISTIDKVAEALYSVPERFYKG